MLAVQLVGMFCRRDRNRTGLRRLWNSFDHHRIGHTASPGTIDGGTEISSERSGVVLNRILSCTGRGRGGGELDRLARTGLSRLGIEIVGESFNEPVLRALPRRFSLTLLCEIDLSGSCFATFRFPFGVVDLEILPRQLRND